MAVLVIHPCYDKIRAVLFDVGHDHNASCQVPNTCSRIGELSLADDARGTIDFADLYCFPSHAFTITQIVPSSPSPTKAARFSAKRKASECLRKCIPLKLSYTALDQAPSVFISVVVVER